MLFAMHNMYVADSLLFFSDVHYSSEVCVDTAKFLCLQLATKQCRTMADVAHLVKSNAPAQEVRTYVYQWAMVFRVHVPGTYKCITVILNAVSSDCSLEISVADPTSAPSHRRSYQPRELLPGGPSHSSTPSDCRHCLQPRAAVSRLPCPTTSPG